jgi:hypothetical protein
MNSQSTSSFKYILDSYLNEAMTVALNYELTQDIIDLCVQLYMIHKMSIKYKTFKWLNDIKTLCNEVIKFKQTAQPCTFYKDFNQFLVANTTTQGKRTAHSTVVFRGVTMTDAGSFQFH